MHVYRLIHMNGQWKSEIRVKFYRKLHVLLEPAAAVALFENNSKLATGWMSIVFHFLPQKVLTDFHV
jgi:hypothetical protein